MGSAAKYDSYSITLSGSSVASIGASPTDSNFTVTDTPGTGGISTILGDVANDPFTAGATDGYTFKEVVTWPGGNGFIASLGGVDVLFVHHGFPPPANGDTLTITPAPGIGGSGEWVINTAAIGCFLGGTMIATPAGECAVESLAAGDLVVTASGAARPVLWVGRSTVSTRFADPVRVLPIRIKAGALGEHVPARDLLVSPGHAVLVDGILVHAGVLVNGTSIVRETGTPVVFTYYHVELASHDVLLADGTPVESFLEGNEDMAFQNWHERPAGTGAAEEMAYPRAKSPRQLPRATKERLAIRASAVATGFAAAA